MFTPSFLVLSPPLSSPPDCIFFSPLAPPLATRSSRRVSGLDRFKKAGAVVIEHQKHKLARLRMMLPIGDENTEEAIFWEQVCKLSHWTRLMYFVLNSCVVEKWAWKNG